MKRPAQEIICEVVAAHDISYHELLSPSRRRPIVAARAEAARLIREELQYSFPRIGRLLLRDHTTILHHVKK